MKPKEIKKIIALSSLTLFTKQAESLRDIDTCKFLAEYYKIVKKHVSSENGEIIKNMGDACMLSFDPYETKKVILCLNSLKNKLDSWLPDTDFKNSKSDIKCHIGNVIEVKFDNTESTDIVGKSVNYLFKMKGNGLLISDDLNRELTAI